ncbi:HPF/RaiA family ribosome-associated protein [Lentimicrobium sp.]|jgi:putative sigma-54 modulation protein|uniref:HPF/RaiA family ribosome-associated protein n=1 Tax=Lentimicrobium sp. TaxID=2034841 RepID=UPI0025FE53C8|nr:HPF/RaiA family ribosome-associated protein [Lentimicrobium sp.]MCO5257317.1 HPF/RaiA family ribosome-associated protein [Lentimicrobium sp.]HOP13084.1 HPF/RaiA family ribosome-associated protein [Lentimicrobium sp.]HPF64113.1 HPF/RaiA family ribosome-associated protein [Lentimicrobium sp.]HPJ61853.1 HPF/RaiA family ribosome-associated protein [Lentimicrobium sp.]HPR25559.1 HPF/RaiA family ribosome-associated protein [Lentimicrobium sp.]
MKVSINAVKFKADKKLEEFINDKVEKLSGVYDGIIGSEVILKLGNVETPENKIAEIRLQIKGNDLFAKKQSKTFEEATDTAVDALRKQLDKHKGKFQK